MSKIIPILTIDDVPQTQKWMFKSRSINFDKDLNLKGQYCDHVYKTITIDSDGLIFRCICHAWLPVSVGNILEFNSLDEIFQHEISQNIVSSIEDGSYRYCDHNSCGILISDILMLQKPMSKSVLLNLALDESCNLSCPSCRTKIKFIDQENPKYSHKLKIISHILNLVNQSKLKITISLAGDGDPFASLLYRHFISNLQNKNLEVEINTNGILIKDFWHKIERIHHNVTRLKISIDAGSKEVYEIVRRGGSWSKLMDSLQFIKKWRQTNKSNFSLAGNFVLQSRNFMDIVKYANLCLDYNFDEINFQKIQDWDTNLPDFNSFEVWKENNIFYATFLEILKDPLLKNPKINFTNLQHIYNETTRIS